MKAERKKEQTKNIVKKPTRGKKSVFPQDFMTPSSQPPLGLKPMDDFQPSKEKGRKIKAKGKPQAYKLQSDIESNINMKGVLEKRIFDAKIEFTLREVLDIAKKDFHELIIDMIKIKRQMTKKMVMVQALDALVSEDEEEELGQVFQ